MPLINLDLGFFGPSSYREGMESKLSKGLDHLRSIQDKTCEGAEFTGWWQYPEAKGFSLVNEVTSFVESLDVEYNMVLVVGIGGSYLGARAVSEALSHSYQGYMKDKAPLMAYVGQHLSESLMLEVMDLLDQRKPIVNVISKSGTTTETSVAFRIIRKYMEDRFGKGEATRRILVTTDEEGGVLRQFCRSEGYRSFIVPSDIGGRFSVLSAVGLVPLSLGGFDILSLMEGAHRVFDEVTDFSDPIHPTIQYACARAHGFELGKRVEALAYGDPKLHYVIEWWKQLFGESEGKNGLGLLPIGLSYTTDLHSLGQYVQDGVRNLLETFIMFEEPDPSTSRQLTVPAGDQRDQLSYLEGRGIHEINRAAMLGSKLAHRDGGVPCLEIQAPTLNEKTLGALFAFFQVSCAVSAMLLGVNPFDQPGVESYKKNLFALMGKPGFEGIRHQLESRLSSQ